MALPSSVIDDDIMDIILKNYNALANNMNILTTINPQAMKGDSHDFDFNRLGGKGYTDRKEQILEAAGELALKFLCYDRIEDPDLTEDAILTAIESGNVSVEEIVEAFRNSLLDSLPDED